MALRDPKCDSVATGDHGRRLPAGLERRSLVEELAGKGVRLTRQRRVLIDIIQNAEQHLDAASLLALAREKEPSIDRATVYRTIELLKELRLLDELDLMHQQGEKHFYEVKTHRDHIHLTCFECGRVEEYLSSLFEQLKQQLSTDAGFDIRAIRLEVGGRCHLCRTSVAGADWEDPANAG